MATETSEEEKLPSPSETVKRLRETFAPAAAKLKPENEPAVSYKPDFDRS